MFQRFSPVVALGALIVLAACGAGPEATQGEATAPASPAPEAGFVSPPQATAIALQGGRILLSGTAPPRARVRLATPAGVAVFDNADAQGRWSVTLPAEAAPQILGLSAEVDARQVQAQGYLLVSGDGKAAVLRAGAGAHRLDRVTGPAAITAFDFDREGGAVASGVAPPASQITLRIDERQMVEGRADAAGRFELALPSPITVGPHRLHVVGDGLDAAVQVQVTAAAPPAPGPFLSRAVSGGLRVDWITPGGGVQSTLILG